MELKCKHINEKPYALTKLDDDSCLLSWIQKLTKMMEANLVEAVELQTASCSLDCWWEGVAGGGE